MTTRVLPGKPGVRAGAFWTQAAKQIMADAAFVPLIDAQSPSWRAAASASKAWTAASSSRR
jgi:hypothetical protein